MKIANINVQNFQGLRNAALVLSTPVALVTGANGAGKSSLRDAVAMALSGKPTRVTLKKNFGDLVTDGAKTGSIRVDLADGRHSVVALPDGKVTFAGAAAREDAEKARAALAYVLDPVLFAAASEDERRQLLFTLTGCAASTEEVQKRLLARGADAVKIDAVLPRVLAGFPSAEKDAKTRATEAKGAWRGITGEAYGDKKAASFSVAKTEVPEGALLQAEQDLDLVDTELDGVQLQLGELQGKLKAQQGRAGQIAGLEERASRKERIQQKLVLDNAELAEWDQRLAEVNAMASGRKAGMVHDLAHALHGLVNEAQPLGIDRPTYLAGEAALADYERAHGPAQLDNVADQAALAKLPEYQQARALCARTVENSARALADAEQVAAQLQALAVDAGEAVSQADVQALQERADVLRGSRQRLAEDLEALRGQLRAAGDADRKTAAAAGHHADVQAWTLIADALAPDGIPGEILADALRPVNDQLFEYAKLAGWARIQLANDMTITADGRLYPLLSESEKWRADCLLALVVAKLSGLRLVLLDRFDVLDVAGRNDLLDLLCALADTNDIDTALVFGTLKSAPASDDTIQSFWIKGGEVVDVGSNEERKAA